MTLAAAVVSFTLPLMQAKNCVVSTDSLHDHLRWEVYARVQSSAYADSGEAAPWPLVVAQAEPFKVAEGSGTPGQFVMFPEPLVLRRPYWLHVVTRNGRGWSCVSNIVGRK